MWILLSILWDDINTERAGVKMVFIKCFRAFSFLSSTLIWGSGPPVQGILTLSVRYCSGTKQVRFSTHQSHRDLYSHCKKSSIRMMHSVNDISTNRLIHRGLGSWGISWGGYTFNSCRWLKTLRTPVKYRASPQATTKHCSKPRSEVTVTHAFLQTS